MGLDLIRRPDAEEPPRQRTARCAPTAIAAERRRGTPGRARATPPGCCGGCQCRRRGLPAVSATAPAESRPPTRLYQAASRMSMRTEAIRATRHPVEPSLATSAVTASAVTASPLRRTAAISSARRPVAAAPPSVERRFGPYSMSAVARPRQNSSVGQRAWAASCAETEPISRPGKPPVPRAPTTIRVGWPAAEGTFGSAAGVDGAGMWGRHGRSSSGGHHDHDL